jgi:hypothetical protein
MVFSFPFLSNTLPVNNSAPAITTNIKPTANAEPPSILLTTIPSSLASAETKM